MTDADQKRLEDALRRTNEQHDFGRRLRRVDDGVAFRAGNHLRGHRLPSDGRRAHG